jgi:GNAT superfamily N-acetyltransferase
MNTQHSYRTAWLRLPDGTLTEVRPIHPDDKPLLLSGFARLSPRSRYLRFMTPTPALSRQQLAYLSELDHVNHVALGVLVEGLPAAVGRWVRLAGDPMAADLAVTVIDEYQRRGIGRALVEALAEVGRHRGVETLHCDVLAENTGMLALLRSLGAELTLEGSVYHSVMPTRAVPPPQVVDGSLIELVDSAALRREAV